MAINTKLYKEKIQVGLSANESFSEFFYNFKFNKKQYRGLIRPSDKLGKKDRVRAAVRRLDDIKAEVKEGVEDKPLDFFVQRYFDSLPDGNYKEWRGSFYDRNIKPSLGQKLIGDVSYNDLQHLVDVLAADYARDTLKNVSRVLGPAFKDARRRGLVTHILTDDLIYPRDKTKPKKIIINATDRARQIVMTITEEYKDDPYWYAFFMFAVQGRRRSEILRLDWDHVMFDEDCYVLETTKSRQTQVFTLPWWIKNALLEFRRERGPVFYSDRSESGRLTDPSKQIERLRKKLGDDFGLHMLRNVLVSAMAERGEDPTHMSGALGHNDANTVNIYLTPACRKGSARASLMIGDMISSLGDNTLVD